jgi:hypothetical protein
MVARWRRHRRSDEPAVWGGGESGLGRRRVQGKSNLGVEARRISLARGAPWWRASGRKEPPAAGWGSGGGRQLGGCGAVVSSGGGRGGEGSLGRWGARRGEREREAFGVELAEDIGERMGGARGREKPRRGRNPRAVRND